CVAYEVAESVFFDFPVVFILLNTADLLFAYPLKFVSTARRIRIVSTSSVARPRALPLLLGESPALVELRRDIQAAARTEAKVLILRETRVGKEVVAQLIHAQSARVGRSFVAVNCSGIPETLLESELFGHVRGSFTGAYRDKPGVIRQAHGGTLFLDELGEMSPRTQAVLLRFTESGEMHPVGAD